MPGEKLGKAVLELRTNSAGLRAGVGQAHKLATKLQQKFTQVAASMQTMGRGMLRSITLPLVGIGVIATKMTADFDKALSEIVGLVGVSRDQVDAWRSDLLELAPALGKSPKELAKAMFFITSAGLRGQDAMDTLVASTKAAVGGLGDTAVVADAATSAINAYGKENITAAEATDILVKTVREGKLAPEDLAGSLGKVIPLASQMGVTFNEVGAVVASLTRIGMTAQNSTVALQAVLTGLLKPTGEAEDALKAVGLSAAGLRKQIREKGLISALDTLMTAVDNDEVALAKVLPNVRALRGALGLMGKNADNTRNILDSLNDSVGATEEAFAAAEQTISQKFAKTWRKLQTSLIQFGEAIAPVIIPMFEKLGTTVKNIADKFANLTPDTKQLIVKFALLAAAAGPVILAFAGLMKAFAVISSAIGLLSSPITLIIAAVVALTIIIVKNWEAIKTATVNFGNAFKEIFVKIKTASIDIVSGMVEIVVARFKIAWEKIKSSVVNFGNNFKEIFIKVKNSIIDIVSGMSEIIIATFKKAWERINIFVNNAWQVIQHPLKAMKGKMEDVELFISESEKDKILSAYDTFFTAAEEKIKTGSAAMANAWAGDQKDIETPIIRNLEIAIETAREKIATAAGEIKKTWKDTTEAIATSTKNLATNTWESVRGLWDTLSSGYTSLQDLFTGLGDEMADALEDAENASDDLNDKLKETKEILEDIGGEDTTSLFGNLKTWLEELPERFGAASGIFKETLIGKKTDDEGNVTHGTEVGTLGAGMDPLLSMAASFAPMISSLSSVNALLNPLTTILQGIMDVLGPVIDSLLAPLVGILKMFGMIIGQTLSPILEALAPIIELVVWVFQILFTAVSPLTTLFQWVFEVIKTSVHNLAEWIKHPFRKSERDIWDFKSYADMLRENIADIWDTDYGELGTTDTGPTGSPAQYQQVRPINNTFYIEDNNFNGAGGLQEFVLLLDDAWHDANRLGLVGA